MSEMNDYGIVLFRELLRHHVTCRDQARKEKNTEAEHKANQDVMRAQSMLAILAAREQKEQICCGA